MRIRSAATLATLFAAMACGRDAPPQPTAPAPSAPAEIETSSAPRRGSTAGIDWIETVTGGARQADPLPMIVAVHGLGGRPEEIVHLFDGFSSRARIVLPYGTSRFHGGHAWWLPAADGGGIDGEQAASGIAAAADALAVAIVALRRERPTVGAPIVTGFSQGGALSFAIAARHPDAIAAAYPLSGWLPAALRSPPESPSPRPPIVAFHGTADERVPIDEARATVTSLTAAGFRAELRELSGLGHTVSPEERAELLRRLDAGVQAMRR